MSFVDWSRLITAGELLASIGMAGDGQDISLAEADATLDEIAATVQRTRREIALEADRLHALIGG